MGLNNLKVGVLMSWMVLMTGWLPGFEATSVHAATMYSYLDDHGDLHATDSPDTIPEKYRAKVQTHEQPDPKVTPPTKFETAKQVAVEKVKALGLTLPTMKPGSASSPRSIKSSGISPSQSEILTYAGWAAVVLLILMYLTKSPMMRLLGLGLLIILGIGTPVLMYVSEDGPADILKQKALAAGQIQQDRLKPAGQ